MYRSDLCMDIGHGQPRHDHAPCLAFAQTFINQLAEAVIASCMRIGPVLYEQHLIVHVGIQPRDAPS